MNFEYSNHYFEDHYNLSKNIEKTGKKVDYFCLLVGIGHHREGSSFSSRGKRLLHVQYENDNYLIGEFLDTIYVGLIFEKNKIIIDKIFTNNTELKNYYIKWSKSKDFGYCTYNQSLYQRISEY